VVRMFYVYVFQITHIQDLYSMCIYVYKLIYTYATHMHNSISREARYMVKMLYMCANHIFNIFTLHTCNIIPLKK
jgi:hypothetical protein